MTTPSYADASFNVAGTTSKWVPLTGSRIVGFYTPSGLTSTAITFNMTPSRQTSPIVSYPVKDSGGSSISFTVTTSSYYGFTQDQIAKFTGCETIQVVGGSSEAAGTLVKLALIARPSI